MLLTLTPRFVSVTVLLHVPVNLLHVLDCLRVCVLRAALFLEYLLKLLEARLLEQDLRPEIILGLLLLINALIQAYLLVFEAGYLTLQLRFIGLLIISYAFEGVQLFEDLLTLCLQLGGILLSLFKLSSDMVDVSLQGQDLLDVVFLLLLMLLELE